jgi:hypothetical protein
MLTLSSDSGMAAVATGSTLSVLKERPNKWALPMASAYLGALGKLEAAIG